ncbi:MAG: ABC transporter permease [Acidobacteriaceae bacterium]|nr:ABC transporter permease [Acidobacteriaceae bacterium]
MEAFFETLLQDLRYALRTLRREPGFATFAILIIALGIGASSTVFSVLNTLLIQPLPFKDPASLVWIANRTVQEGDLSGETVQVGRLMDLRARNRSFSDIAGYFAFYGVGDSKLTGNGEPERLSAVPVSQNFFPLLGVQPQLGRLFSAEECKFNGPHTVLLSHGLWARRFASDPAIVGKAITLDDTPATVVGVLPASFDFASVFAPGTHIDLFSPFPLTQETDRWGNTLALVGRIKPGVSIEQAQAEATVLGDQISKEHPHQNWLHPKLIFLAQHVSGRLRPALLILASSVAVVMLIVCANLSNLLLARTATRQKEMAIRAAMGAGQQRLIRQLLTESIVLTCYGAVLGLALAMAATRGMGHLTAFNIPLLSSVRVNPGALAFTVVAAVLTGLALGMAPALQVSAIPLHGALVERGSSESRVQVWMRGVLVVAEIAFACVLLVGAGLLVRSFLRVLEVQMGFRPESAATIRIDPSDRLYPTQARKNAYYDEALRRVKAIPEVQAAGLTDTLPLGHNRAWGSPAKGQVYKDADFPTSFVRVVSDGYIKALGMSLRKGRDFTPRDTPATAPVIVINEALAERLWPGQDPIGHFIQGDCAPFRQVIGVVGNVRHIALEKESGSEMYIPIRQCQDYGSVDLVVRSSLPLAVLQSNVENALRPIAPELPKGAMRPLVQLVDRAVSPRRFIVLLLSGFAAFALILASLGIYGVISYSVNRRTQEIGIRMALGASALQVQWSIVIRTLALATGGMIGGAVTSLALARWLNGLLFGVSYGDPMTFAGAAAILLGVAVLAGYLPSRRASRIDPMIALRIS